MNSVMDDTASSIAANKRYQAARTGLTTSLLNLRTANCNRAKDVYDMNGLLDRVPVEWNCDEFYRRDSAIDETLASLQEQTLDVTVGDPTVVNIVMVGLTGAGKSYFGNALLGSTSPGDSFNPFSSKASQESVTQGKVLHSLC